ncbi:hypothetical protein HYFRA_00002520 [Hymenoscyphus fraxineus]|uniref:Uncharacterized protein n=1 Tax=Hymenoscyphus fraxineus TaxID=746836 RepID=A0A9N9PV58_9HELO|nr:hypothetical protein HYFRA_00002520 [Hymenoscyphus fraxineus]
MSGLSSSRYAEHGADAAETDDKKTVKPNIVRKSSFSVNVPAASQAPQVSSGYQASPGYQPFPQYQPFPSYQLSGPAFMTTTAGPILFQGQTSYQATPFDPHFSPDYHPDIALGAPNFGGSSIPYSTVFQHPHVPYTLQQQNFGPFQPPPFDPAILQLQQTITRLENELVEEKRKSKLKGGAVNSPQRHNKASFNVLKEELRREQEAVQKAHRQLQRKEESQQRFWAVVKGCEAKAYEVLPDHKPTLQSVFAPIYQKKDRKKKVSSSFEGSHNDTPAYDETSTTTEPHTITEASTRSEPHNN